MKYSDTATEEIERGKGRQTRRGGITVARVGSRGSEMRF
jgi:hypothetical protein